MPRAVLGTTLVATILAVLLLTGLPLAQERKPPSLEVTLEWLGTKMAQAAYVDSQGDRWEWQSIEMTACAIQVRETIHASGGPLATEYTIPLSDAASVNSLDGWVSLRTHRPTIVSRTLLRVGDPSVERGDLFQLKFSDAALARRVQRAMLHAAVLCRRNAPGKEPF